MYETVFSSVLQQLPLPRHTTTSLCLGDPWFIHYVLCSLSHFLLYTLPAFIRSLHSFGS